MFFFFPMKKEVNEIPMKKFYIAERLTLLSAIPSPPQVLSGGQFTSLHTLINASACSK